MYDIFPYPSRSQTLVNEYGLRLASIWDTTTPWSRLVRISTPGVSELAGERWADVADQAPTIYAVWGGAATPAQALYRACCGGCARRHVPRTTRSLIRQRAVLVHLRQHLNRDSLIRRSQTRLLTRHFPSTWSHPCVRLDFR
jgi:hypothetical protein